MPAGFIERFLACAADQPDAIAVENAGDGAQVTYHQLRTLAERLRAALAAEGIGPGDAVLVSLPTSAELFATFFALTSLEAVAVPLSSNLTEYELAPICEETRPVGIIASAIHGPLAAALRGCARLRFVLTSDDAAVAEAALLAGATDGAPGDGARLPRVLRWEALPDARSPLVPPAADAIVSCHFTYRGLGYPLGALHTYEQYSWGIDGVVRRHEGSGRSVHLAALPLHPVYGLVAGMLLPLCNGSSVLIAHSGQLGALMVNRRVRFACLVPLLLRGVVAESYQRPVRGLLHPDLEIISGGSLLSPDAEARAAERLGVVPFQGYGLSEALPVTSNHAGACRAGSLGVPICPDTRIEILDAGGQVLPPGKVGEVAISGRTIMSGYLGRPRETALYRRDGRLLTGDLGYLDSGGFLFFAGRRYPFSKPASQMVDLTEVERVLELHPAVDRARVNVRYDSRIGDRLWASVAIRDGMNAEPGELVAFCRRRLSGHKVPRTFGLSAARRPLHTSTMGGET